MNGPGDPVKATPVCETWGWFFMFTLASSWILVLPHWSPLPLGAQGIPQVSLLEL